MGNRTKFAGIFFPTKMAKFHKIVLNCLNFSFSGFFLISFVDDPLKNLWGNYSLLGFQLTILNLPRLEFHKKEAELSCFGDFNALEMKERFFGIIF